MTSTPFSPSDLRAIADALDQIQPALLDKNGDYTPAGGLTLRIEVARPDTEEVIGHFVLLDGWVGFAPLDRTRS